MTLRLRKLLLRLRHVHRYFYLCLLNVLLTTTCFALRVSDQSWGWAILWALGSCYWVFVAHQEWSRVLHVVLPDDKEGPEE